MDCSPPGSSVHGILQARILEWVAISFSRGSPPPRNRIHVSWSPALAGEFFTTEPPGKPVYDNAALRVPRTFPFPVFILTTSFAVPGLFLSPFLLAPPSLPVVKIDLHGLPYTYNRGVCVGEWNRALRAMITRRNMAGGSQRPWFSSTVSFQCSFPAPHRDRRGECAHLPADGSGHWWIGAKNLPRLDSHTGQGLHSAAGHAIATNQPGEGGHAGRELWQVGDPARPSPPPLVLSMAPFPSPALLRILTPVSWFLLSIPLILSYPVICFLPLLSLKKQNTTKKQLIKNRKSAVTYYTSDVGVLPLGGHGVSGKSCQPWATEGAFPRVSGALRSHPVL